MESTPKKAPRSKFPALLVVALALVALVFVIWRNITAGFFPHSVDLFLYPFTFQQLEKTFCNRIIMAVTATAQKNTIIH